ncbi:atypical chemokine receptor 4 [Spea bombifrons]|uniref:atypical chemokine receptor 4 n=1 Tax=Spea bombifrons TaxID=233779 RepID=UPI0023490C3D|nr:atypical chemokine receptor 4 [Spea bombifrons]
MEIEAASEIRNMSTQTNITLTASTENYDDYADTTFDYNNYEERCEKSDVRMFAQIFLPAFYSVAFVLGTAGNSLVVAIYACHKKTKTKTDVYILNLAIADLLLLFTLPFWAVDSAVGWLFGTGMCKITSALYTVNFGSGMQFLACISLDRYFTVNKASSHRNFAKRCRAICLFVWATSILLSIPDFYFSTVKEHNGRRTCLPEYPKDSVKVMTVLIQILDIVFCFVLPFFIMLYCYSAMAKVLLKKDNIKRSRSLKVLLSVVAIFLITQLPYNIIKFWRAIDLIYALITICNTSRTIDIMIQVTKSIALFHCCLNPVLYAFMGATFQSYITKTIKKCGFWQKQTSSAEEYSMHSENHVEETISLSL